MKTSKLGYQYMGKLLGKYFFLILILLGLTIFDSVSYTYVPMFIGYIYSVLDATGEYTAANLPGGLINFFASFKNPTTIAFVTGLGLAIFQLIRGLVKFGTGVYRNTIGENISRNIRIDLYNHIQKLPYSYHNNADTGDLIQRCTSDIDHARNFLCRQLPDVVGVFSTLIAALWQMIAINVPLTLVSLVIIPVAVSSSYIFGRYVDKKYTEIEKAEAKLMTIMQENLAGVRVVKAFANEQYEVDVFEKQNQEYAKMNLSLNKKAAIFWGFGDFTTIAQYLLTTSVAISMVTKNPNSISFDAIVIIVMLLGSFIWPIRSLGRLISDFAKCGVACTRIKEILDIPDEFQVNGSLFPEIKGAIEFQDVSFKFDDTDQNLIEHMNFKINAGETVAIIGKTGSGKSTIAKLMTRLYDYQDGKILLDDVDIKDIDKQYLRHHVGLLLQDPFLYSRTVYDNIAITNKKADSKVIYDAAKISSLDREITTFDKGYDTLVGEKGATLSGGQKQRLAIARILVGEKNIIIFDDSLSAVDTETDLMIRKALKERDSNSTMIIITHRITTAKQADKIIVLEDGKVSQIGVHETLANVDGLYKKLWDIQGSLEKEFLQMLNEGGEA